MRHRAAGAREERGQPARVRRTTYKWFALPLVILWLVPLGAFALAVPQAGKAEEAAVKTDSVPSSLPVGSREIDHRQSADAQFTFGSPASLEAPTGGMLTSIEVTPGSAIEQGQPLFAIDGTPVAASLGGVPIYRDIVDGMEGPDVESLTKLLISRGLLPPDGASNYVSSLVVDAINAYQESIGVEPSSTFSRSYAAYVPEDARFVSKINHLVGSTVSQGVDLLHLAGPPLLATLKASAQGQTLAALSGAPLTATVGTEIFELSSLEPTGEELAAFYDFVSTHAQSTSGDPSGAQSSEASQKYSGLVLALRDPVQVGTVPAAAVFTSPSGTMCLFMSTNTGVTAERLAEAEPVAGELGTIGVDLRFVGKSVLVDASTAPESAKLQCK